MRPPLSATQYATFSMPRNCRLSLSTTPARTTPQQRHATPGHSSFPSRPSSEPGGRHRQDSDTPSKTATAMWSPLTPTGSTMHKVSITCSQPCARKTQTWSSAPAPTAEVRQEKRPGHCCVPCPDSPCVISLPVSGYTHTKVSHFLQVGPPPASTIRISASYA